MNITFAKKKLKKEANNDSLLHRRHGKERANKLRLRLSQLHDAVTLEDVRYLPGKFHELTENRKGQWACDLDQPYRLVFRPHENPIPISSSGAYIWKEIKGVEVIEIINYHKEK